MIIGGNYGSEGKGNIASYIANTYGFIDLSITNTGPNAAHTFWYDEKFNVSKYIPVSAIIDRNVKINLCAASIIDVDVLLSEINKYQIDHRNIKIHPNATIVKYQDTISERSLHHIGSTMSGGGAALSKKIMRQAPIAKDCESLKDMIGQHPLKSSMTILVETGQGVDLSLDSIFYPWCTSRVISPSQVLSDIGGYPSNMGCVIVPVRSYPIRVANPIDDDGVVGSSGMCYIDQQEVSWDELKLQPEYTTMTKRVRRVFTWSEHQYINMLKCLQPSSVVLTFADYLSEDNFSRIIKNHKEINYYTVGPKYTDLKSCKK